MKQDKKRKEHLFNLYLSKRVEQLRLALDKEFLEYYSGPKEYNQIKNDFSNLEKLDHKLNKSLSKLEKSILNLTNAISTSESFFHLKKEINIDENEDINNLCLKINTLKNEINNDFIDVQINKDIKETLALKEKVETFKRNKKQVRSDK